MTRNIAAVLSPARAAVWGAIVAAPAAVFLGANLLNEAGIGAPYRWIEPLVGRSGVFSLGSPLVLLGGIGTALVLNALAIARLGVRRDAQRLVCTLTVEPRLPNLAVLVTAGLMLATIATYLALENYAHLLTRI